MHHTITASVAMERDGGWQAARGCFRGYADIRRAEAVQAWDELTCNILRWVAEL